MRIWVGDFSVAELDNLDASKVHARRLSAREVLTSKKGEQIIFSFADGSGKLWRDHEIREPTLRRDQPVMSEDLRKELQGNWEGSQPTEKKDDAEARNDFWSMEGHFVDRYHIEHRIQLHVSKEESFPIPLKYIDVTRTTHTDLDVAQEKRFDDNWNIDEDRRLSDSWTGFTKFTLLQETPT